ncbi:CRISPR-associated protein Csx19 [Thermogutta sp.]|uniref:type III-D CRISPR-associated protein Csx19 n=1 Tax=Thermogutta sp. TaxID=1962930 RepID=UPI00321F8F59
MNTQLFTYTREGINLCDALKDFASLAGTEGAIALLYSPRRCELAVLDDGILRGSDGRPLQLDSVFEARSFSVEVEFRWRNDPTSEKRHQAVIIAEKDLSAQLRDWQVEQRVNVIKQLPQTYLLWGEGTGRTVGGSWSELATARIGTLNVPVPNVGRNERVLLHTVEYIIEAEHGNAVVFDERLVKLEVARG